MAAEFLSTLSLRRATIEFDSRHSDQNISIHALLAESDTNYQRDDGDPAAFLSTLSLRRATAMGQLAAQLNEISIHALLAESDRKRCQSRPDSRNFYPRSPCGERLTTLTTSRRTEQFLSTLSLRRATVRQVILAEPFIFISIHALLAESDHRPAKSGLGRPIFLSTLSLRRATHDEAVFSVKHRHFYPRSPCGERPLLPLCYNRPSDFYPRSPCGERLVAVCYDYYSIGFLSTLSLRRATETVFALLYEPDISIHALLAESDHQPMVQRQPGADFYPRSPCGERPQARRALEQAAQISIHALLAESDPIISSATSCRWLFLSTLSLRRATGYPACSCHFYQYFYPRSPCGERRRNTHGYHWSVQISIHALLAESDIR